jgi:hypothetical protein
LLVTPVSSRGCSSHRLQDPRALLSQLLNNFGWTLSQEGAFSGPVSNFSGAPLLSGRAVINIGEFKIDLGTLGGPNSWMNWGGINDFAQAVGDAETAVPE